MLSMIVALFGGLAIFIYAMDEMGKGLQKVAGASLKKILEVLTSVPIIGVAVGALVTAVIQSSSATTVMVIGFVNAGLMNLKQAIAVIMGSNIGTTVTSQLITFNITQYYMGMIAIGFILSFVVKKDRIRNIGKVVFAFGLLFMGLDLMSEAMYPLRESTAFASFMTTFGEYAILAVLAGALLTCVIQSSSASMGILLAMTSTGLITLDIALPAILGFNIGTCVTCLLASIGTKINAKRAALAHVTFNIAGALIFLLLLPVFEDIVLMISPEGNIDKQIANAHTIFNVVTTLVLLPFVNILAKFVTKVLPGEDSIGKAGAIYLDKRALIDSNVALGLVHRETIRMAELARENIAESYEMLSTRNIALAEDIDRREDVVDILEHDIVDYLIQIRQNGLSELQSVARADMFHIVGDIERISDRSTNIKEAAENCIANDLYFSEAAKLELEHIYDKLIHSIDNAVAILKQKDDALVAQIMEQEEVIDGLEEKYRNEHICRLEEGKCSHAVGVVFLDVLSNFERVGDHCDNIAVRIKEHF